MAGHGTFKDGKLGVPDEVVSTPREQGLEVHVARSREAVDLYRDLAGSRPTGLLLHSTC